ncbi:hypothetical protein AC739_13380 [Planococcus glaciei]|uniref:hypothetical protein n=1 Tax=Planococcus glaciei TaxID=459472 RepID=UPI00069EA52B|nr:hypothetical protein [Planococcus glaciei]KOF09743.1 hypothetical protein AC739_13380 [Planococcus glaciei]
MQPEKKRTKPNTKQSLQRYLFPITIISSVLISGSIGYAASQLAINNSSSDSIETNNMKNQVAEARNESIQVIETEIPKIISDLEKYNQDIDLISENIEWLDENLMPIRDAIGEFDTAISVVNGVSTIVPIPIVSKMSTSLAFTQIKLDEVDSILFRMENLAVIKQEMDDSHQRLKSLYEEYQKESNVEQLLLIEQELNSNLIYQIEDLRNMTIEAHEVFELSSNILNALNNAKSSFNSIKEKGDDTLEAIQFWKDNKEDAKIGGDIKKDLEKDLEDSKEEIQNLPNELAQQSRDSITSINKVQKELQTIRITHMVIGK